MYGFCPLSSGSKGNAIFFGSKKINLLIDAGISASTLCLRLQQIGVELSRIDAILITHEHLDHIKGVPSIISKHPIPIFANSDTARAIIAILGDRFSFKIFTTGEPFSYGDIEVTPFSIQHDTPDPVAFTISNSDGIKSGFCTDLGFPTSLVCSHLRGCDYLYVESNHDPDKLRASQRPPLYKQRVLSRQGHLSNQQCGDLIANIAHPKLKQIYLAHLSEECNTPQLALSSAQAQLEQLGYAPTLSVASQNSISKPTLFTPASDPLLFSEINHHSCLPT